MLHKQSTAPVEEMTRRELIDGVCGYMHPEHAHNLALVFTTAALRALLVFYRSSDEHKNDGRRCGIALLAELYTRRRY